MAARALADAAFLIALLSERDCHHKWAADQALRFALPWSTCEAVLSEAFHLLGAFGGRQLSALLRRRALAISFILDREQEPVLKLMQKYSNVPMSLADACLVRMSETIAESIVLTTDADFLVYRRHSRQIVPCSMPF